MSVSIPRRTVVQYATSGAVSLAATGRAVLAWQGQRLPDDSKTAEGKPTREGSLGPAYSYQVVRYRSAVSVIKGVSRRKTVHDALAAIDDQIGPAIRRKKYVVLKPNTVNVTRPLGCTDADALRGVLDYLAPRFKGSVVIAESSGNSETWEAYENFGYKKLPSEYRAQRVSLVDLNEEARYEIVNVLDADLHLVPIRLAARLLDPEAFVIGVPRAKTHGLTMVTLAINTTVL